MAKWPDDDAPNGGALTGGIWRRRKPGRAKRPTWGRSFDDDSWTWFGQEAEAEPRRPGLYLALATAGAGLALIVAGGAFLALRHGGEDGSGERAAQPISVGAVTPSPHGPTSTLLVWNPAPGAGWQTADLRIEPRADSARAIPFLLRLDSAVVGEVYEITVGYSCAKPTGRFEFLVDYDRDEGGQSMSAPGPGRVSPDAAARVPDDPASGVDDGHRGSFQIWGGTPVAIGPGAMPGSCLGEKMISLGIRALAPTMWVMWGGEVAVGTNSRPSGEAELEMSVLIDQVATEPARVRVLIS